MTPLARSLILVCIALCCGHMAVAQTLAPRAYVITPVRANAVTLSLSFLDGGLDFNGSAETGAFMHCGHFIVSEVSAFSRNWPGRNYHKSASYMASSGTEPTRYRN